MIRKSFLKLCLAGFIISLTSLMAEARETRCGWFENPTPGNASLYDKDGEWIIGMQGGHQADGDWPVFSDKQWVKTNVNYGYGCACLDVDLDKNKKTVTKIHSAKAKDLSACKKDKMLKEPGK